VTTAASPSPSSLITCFLLDGNQLKLKQVAAASGTRYSDGNYTFWSKGSQAFVQRGDDIILNDCVQK